MSKEKIIELIVCLLSITALVLALTTNVFASDVGQLLGNGNNTNNNAGFSNITEGNRSVNNSLGSSANNSANNNANKNANANKNVNNNVTEMPDTGVDYSVVTIIAICGVSAVYAYKKIRDYKNI